MWTAWQELDRDLRTLDSLRRRMDRWFDEAEQPTRSAFPAMNLYEDESGWTLLADVPGMTEADLQLSMHRNTLTVAGERKLGVLEGAAVHRNERRAAKFERMVRLPGDVDAEHVSASVKDGVLTVTLPKSAAARPRRIEIATH